MVANAATGANATPANPVTRISVTPPVCSVA
jgi:hypothetical protein